MRITDPERTDLAAVAEMLQRVLEGRAAPGFVRGRTILRDAVIAHLGCSELDAEELIDTMVGRCFVRYSGDPSEVADGGAWWIDPVAG